MDILITGANGFVGKNFVVSLEAIRDGKDRTHLGLEIGQIFRRQNARSENGIGMPFRLIVCFSISSSCCKKCNY